MPTHWKRPCATASSCRRKRSRCRSGSSARASSTTICPRRTRTSGTHWSGAGTTTEVPASYASARPYRPRAYETLPSGVELSAAARVGAYLPPVELRRFAAGNPVDLATGAEGTLYVLDAAAGQVARYAASGTLLGSFGGSGTGTGQLACPQALAIAPDGRVFVADTGNDRIQVFSATGDYERTIGESGPGFGQLRGPTAIAVDGERIVVAEPGNGRVSVFGIDGQAQATFPNLAVRGATEVSGHGLLLAAPAQGILSTDGTRYRPAGLSPTAQEELPAPLDVAPGEDGLWAIDASTSRVVGLTDGFGYRRTLSGFTRPPIAVASSARREMEAVFVSDGAEVIEIGLPVPSPVPAVTELKARLAANDVSGALALIHPLQRELFAEIYQDRGAELPGDAAAMEGFEIDAVREKRAIVRIWHTIDAGGTPRQASSPVTLVRTEDGTWLIYDY